MRTRFPRHLWGIGWRDERIADYALNASAVARILEDGSELFFHHGFGQM